MDAAGMTRRMLGASVAMAVQGLGSQVRPPDAEGELSAAQERTRANIDALRRFQIPAATEPSFSFKP